MKITSFVSPPLASRKHCWHYMDVAGNTARHVFPEWREAVMTASTPATRLARALNDARVRRDERLTKSALRSELDSYRTSTELSELAAIAARHEHTDTGDLRKVLSHRLAS
jgi:hypothetical protein